MMTKYTPILLSTFILGACSDPLVGEWEGRRSSFGELNVDIEIEPNGEGEVTTRTTGYRYKGDLAWEKMEKREYEIEETCSEVTGATCPDDENTWHCDMDDDREGLKCTLEYEDGTYERDLDGSRAKFKFRRKD